MFSGNNSVRGAVLRTCVATATFIWAGDTYADSYRVMTSFHGRDGSSPLFGAPAVDSPGNVYLTTVSGGRYDRGTVVKFAPGQGLKALHSFHTDDGDHPYGGVLYDESSGYIFGTACNGGANAGGVLFELHPDGKYKILHDFDGLTEGRCPLDSPVRDTKGNFYGTAHYDGPGGYGTVWKLSYPGRALKVLHSFNLSDGGAPNARLIRGKDGTFYGTASTGRTNGRGTVFSISAGGQFTTLYNFDITHGDLPLSFLTQDRKGNLYGTTSSGGDNGSGVIFKLAPDGTATVIYSFIYGSSSGSNPESNVVLLNDKLYGTTGYSGDPNCACGTVFEAGMDGSINVLHAFTGSPDGNSAFAGLTLGQDGVLYGDTALGGTKNMGTVYRIKR